MWKPIRSMKPKVFQPVYDIAHFKIVHCFFAWKASSEQPFYESIGYWMGLLVIKQLSK